MSLLFTLATLAVSDTLKTLAEEAVSDGHVSQTEIDKLDDAIFADGIVSDDELKVLFYIDSKVDYNDARSDDAWVNYFATTITKAITRDGKIDDSEAGYLRTAMDADQTYSPAEKALATALRNSGAEMTSEFMAYLEGISST